MRDEKEIAPKEAMKPKYEKYLHGADANLRDKFNEIMLSYARKELDVSEKLLMFAAERENLFSIGLGILKNPGSSNVAVSPHLVAQGMLLLAFGLKWHDMVQKIIKEGYDRKQGYPVALSSAFVSAAGKGHYNEVKEAITETFRNERNEEGCALLAALEDKKLSLEFKNELFESANENERAKMNALAALSTAVFDDMEIKTNFISLLDDWDDDVRGFCAGVLAKGNDEEAATKALELLPQEHSAEMKFHFYRILENNKETVVPLLLTRLEKAKDEKEAKVLVEILLKMEKKEKIKGLAEKIKSKLDEAAKRVLEKLVK